MKQHSLILLVLALGGLGMGCRPRPMTEEQQFHYLFEGYQLMLVDDLPKEKRIEDVETPSLRDTYPLEPRVVPGRVYVFRKTTEISNEDMALRVFPERLASIGARITKAPHSSKDLVYLIIGGPLFRIEFEKDGHRATIFNRMRTSDNPQEVYEELILTFR
ncbi:MAG: hypothetical protein ACREA0_00950 [bacterium]